MSARKICPIAKRVAFGVVGAYALAFHGVRQPDVSFMGRDVFLKNTRASSMLKGAAL